MVAIICVGNIELSPFARKYTDVMDSMGISYDIIHWNRYNNNEYKDNVYTYYKSADRFGSKLKRAISYIGFAAFARKLIKKNKYDKLIILTTQTALILADKLIFKYKKRYFFDYRDSSYEYIKPYSSLINKICNKAHTVSVSSRGFMDVIKTDTKTFMSHNFQTENYQKRDKFCTFSLKDTITVGYIGVLREYEYLKKIADIFGKDRRFCFVISGAGDCENELRAYCLKYPNISVLGAYKETEKSDIIRSFDIICYNYPYSFVNFPAVANKFYDGLIYKKPMFANKRTYSGKLIDKHGLGISIDEDDTDITDKIYDYMKNLNKDNFCTRCEEYLKTVIEDEKLYISAIEDFVKGA